MVSGWLGVNIDPEEGPRRIPIERLYAGWAALCRELGDPAVGTRAAIGWTVADLDLFGFCVATAPDGGAAVRTAARYSDLVTDSGSWIVDEERDPVAVVWNRAGPMTLGRDVSNEVAVASFAVCLRELTGTIPLAIELRHRRPGEQRDLLGCPVRFGCDRDALLIARRDLAAVPRQANAALWRFLSVIADDEVKALRPRGLRAMVERALCDALDGDRQEMPSAREVARSLGMSERTLRRRLREEEMTFRGLLDGVRRDRAHELVAESTAPLTEVAMAAGFADVSALGHAWRRWFGAAPSVTRSRPLRRRA